MAADRKVQIELSAKDLITKDYERIKKAIEGDNKQITESVKKVGTESRKSFDESKAAAAKAKEEYGKTRLSIAKLREEYQTVKVAQAKSKLSLDELRASVYKARLEKDKLAQATKEAAQKAKGFSIDIKSVVAALGGMYILHKINGLIQSSIQAYGEEEEAIAKVTATILSTKSAAGVTTDELVKMASGLQGVTTFADDTILRGQSMLLTFKKIGKDIFPQATEAMLNLSTAMGTDVKETAIQLGKALNDPITGLTALRRVGITFSAGQEEVIKNFQKTGQVAEAQKVILAELESQFGGLARAVATTGTGPLLQFKNIWGDIKEKIGAAFLPIIIAATEKLKAFFATFNTSIFDKIGRAFLSLGGFIAGTVKDFGTFAKVFGDDLPAILATVGGAFEKLLGVFAMVQTGLLQVGEIFLKTIQWISKIDKYLGRPPNPQAAELEAKIKAIGEAGERAAERARAAFAGEIFAPAIKQAEQLKKAMPGGAMLAPDETYPDVEDPGAKATREKAAKEAQDRLDAAKKIDDELRIMRVSGLQREIEELNQKEAQALEIKLAAGQSTLAVEAAYQAQRIALINKSADEDAKIHADLAKKKIEAEKTIRASQIATGKSAVGNLQEMAKAWKTFGPVFKAAAITQTIIDTIASAQASYLALAGIPVVGPVLGAAAAAIALGAGYARVSAIKAQKFAQGGFVKDGSTAGDNTMIRANRGEAVLNAVQQRNFMAMANGRAAQGPTITMGDININAPHANAKEVAQAVNQTMQERLRDLSSILKRREALLVT